MKIARRKIVPGGRVEFDGLIYRGGARIRALCGQTVLVDPVNGTRAAVALFHTRSFAFLGFAFNRALARTARTRALLRQLFEQRRQRFMQVAP